MEDRLQVEYPGLIEERLPSGQTRYRVRVKGNRGRRIRLTVGPDHPKFTEHYHAARRGILIEEETLPEDTAIRNSVSWLTYKYMAHFEKQVEAGQLSPKTLKKRSRLMQRLRDKCGDYSFEIPTVEIIKLRDEMADTPAQADAMVEAIRGMFRFAIDSGITKINPAIGIPKIDAGKGGAVPWTVEDLKMFRQAHPKGTQAHLCLTLFMFTACRIGDAITLGRNNESQIQGIQALSWQPEKKNSQPVQIPIMPPLYEATRAVKVVGPGPYLRKMNGQTYKNADQLGQRLSKWCAQAGLKNRSAHGIRKAAGHLLALEGCTQYQIMCIHGHASPRTSEVYTKGVERWNMAQEAMQKLAGMEW